MSSTGHTYSEIKSLVSAMSNAFRNSHGGSIMERFENVSKLLFLKMYAERHTFDSGLDPFSQQKQETNRDIYERARGLWQETLAMEQIRLSGRSSKFPGDVEAVATCIRLLRGMSLLSATVDVRGAAYEELLRNTFEKNENQQYFTPTSVVNFVVSLSGINDAETICDPACGSGGFLTCVLDRTRCLNPQTERTFYGFDIDERMAWVAKTNMLIHDGSPSNIRYVSHNGSLGQLKTISGFLPKEGIDLILANPPFGSDMTDEKALNEFETGKGRASRRRSILFIERSLQLLKPGGKLGIIVDDSVLNLDGNADIRELIRREAVVLAVVSLPDVTFMPYSTAKSSILLLQKKDGMISQRSVFMAKADQVGKRPNGDVLYDEMGAVVSDFPKILSAWAEFNSNGFLQRQSQPEIYSTELSTNQADRFDFNYYHPSRFESERAIDNGPYPAYRLDELFDFVSGSINPSQEMGDEAVKWIGLAEIESKTGVYAPKSVLGSSIKSQAHCFKSGDILLSRLRPELRKVILVSDEDADGICSSELIVLRKKENPPVDFFCEYVANALRSDLAFGQEVNKITGLGRPRIGIASIRELRIPIPSTDKQQSTATTLDEALSQYRRACAKAEDAKRRAHDSLMRAYDVYIESSL